MMYLQVLFGFGILLIAAEVLVRGAVSLASRLGISTLVIGMTVVAMGTSAPELVVTLDAAGTGAPGMALGNLVGSNIANILLIMGVSCIIGPMVTKASTLKRDGAMLLGGTLLFIGLAMTGELGSMAGIVLLAAFVLFLGVSYWRGSHDAGAAADVAGEVEGLQGQFKSLPASLLAIICGLAGLMYGADILVEGGVQIARNFGITEAVIGLTLFAFGTSLPELAASGIAAWRGHSDVAVGNVVGSNMFNLLAVGGIVSTVEPLPVMAQIQTFDIWVMLAATVLILPLMVLGWRMGRAGGAVFFSLYIGYIAMQAYGIEKIFENTLGG